MRPSERAPDQTRDSHAGNRRQPLRRGLVPGHLRPHQGAGHRQRRGGRPRPGCATRARAGSRPSTACCPAPPTARGRREAAQGKQSGRTQEIQRLIGRSLRAVVDMKALGERQIVLDCDVIQADGGARTAAITGAWVALRLAAATTCSKEGVIEDATRSATRCAAVSAAASSRTLPVLDLDYEEDTSRRGRRQFRADRQWRHRRDPGHRREARLHPRPSSPACSPWPRAASAGCTPCSARRSAGSEGHHLLLPPRWGKERRASIRKPRSPCCSSSRR